LEVKVNKEIRNYTESKCFNSASRTDAEPIIRESLTKYVFLCRTRHMLRRLY
jgi:hypothetical protein